MVALPTAEIIQQAALHIIRRHDPRRTLAGPTVLLGVSPMTVFLSRKIQ